MGVVKWCVGKWLDNFIVDVRCINVGYWDKLWIVIMVVVMVRRYKWSNG